MRRRNKIWGTLLSTVLIKEKDLYFKKIERNSNKNLSVQIYKQ